MKRISAFVLLVLMSLLPASASAAPPTQPTTRPVPQLQILPLPDAQAAFTRDGVEIARYHFGAALERPFMYPLIGPAGRSLTRMGHPRDPVSHSHHNSIWISHNDVNGVSFWDDRKSGRIVHQRIDAFEDEGSRGEVGTETAAIRSTNHWINSADKKLLLIERRQTRLEVLPHNELLLFIDLQLETPPNSAEPVILGKTPFGLLGVRMAKTVGTNDGGGVIRNSEGGVNEKEIFWKSAKWVDYSGPIANEAIEGITLMDHPSNPRHPTGFHVRSDGWMGAALTLNEALPIETGKPLRVRYGLYVHTGMPEVAVLNTFWDRYASTKPPADLAPTKK